MVSWVTSRARRKNAGARPADLIDSRAVHAPVADPTLPRTASSRITWALDAGLAAFAGTTGAMLAFGRLRGGAFASFEVIGRRVALDVALPRWGDILLGLVVHAGQCLALGAGAALLLGAGRIGSRLRAALLIVFAWELAARVPWLAFVRADVAAGFGVWPRAALAVLLGAALAFAPRD